MIQFITHSPSVSNLRPIPDVMQHIRQSSYCRLCALTDAGFHTTLLMASNSPDLHSVDYSLWSIMQEKVYQAHIVNMDELKHWLVQVWAELDYRITAAGRQWRCCLGACDSRV